MGLELPNNEPQSERTGVEGLMEQFAKIPNHERRVQVQLGDEKGWFRDSTAYNPRLVDGTLTVEIPNDGGRMEAYESTNGSGNEFTNQATGTVTRITFSFSK